MSSAHRPEQTVSLELDPRMLARWNEHLGGLSAADKQRTPIGLGMARCILERLGQDITDEEGVPNVAAGLELCGLGCNNLAVSGGVAALVTSCDLKDCPNMGSDGLVVTTSQAVASFAASVCAEPL